MKKHKVVQSSPVKSSSWFSTIFDWLSLKALVKVLAVASLVQRTEASPPPPKDIEGKIDGKIVRIRDQTIHFHPWITLDRSGEFFIQKAFNCDVANDPIEGCGGSLYGISRHPTGGGPKTKVCKNEAGRVCCSEFGFGLTSLPERTTTHLFFSAVNGTKLETGVEWRITSGSSTPHMYNGYVVNCSYP